MHRQRVLVAFGIAWITALLLSWGVYKKTTAPQSRQLVQVVAAAKDLPVGKRIESSDLKLNTSDRKDLPSGVFFKISDVAGRAVTSALVHNELVLDGKLAAKGGGESMTALIEPGMRAVSVQINETSGVSGFIQPGTRVDVLFTRTFSNGDAASTTILQNVKVIAYGKQLEPQTKAADPRDNVKITVATLLVTQEQAQKLALAIQRGRIQLVLRNPLDDKISDEVDPVVSEDLGIEEPAKPVPPRPPAPKAEVKPPPPPPLGSGNAVEQRVKSGENGHVVHVYRGSKVSEDVFE
jgi:pilus assembly protein CpaB